MPTLTEPVGFRIISGPKGYPPLANFCSGKTRRAEYEVNSAVSQLFTGANDEQQVVVVLEKRSAERDFSGNPVLVGACGISTRPLGISGLPGLSPSDHGAYICSIGTDQEYRKYILKDGKTTPGSQLLRAALEVIKFMFGRDELPFVKAMIVPENTPSKTIFDERGFESLGLGPMREQVHVVRLPGLAANHKRTPGWSTQSIQSMPVLEAAP